MSDLQEKRDELNSVSLEVDKRLEEIRRAKGEKHQILKAVRSERALEIKRSKELGQAARNLERMISKIATW